MSNDCVITMMCANSNRIRQLRLSVVKINELSAVNYPELSGHLSEPENILDGLRSVYSML